jgi:ribosomal protection tetracycline resistance protein
MRQLAVGILAHVDAGKTTLAESLLYRSGKLRSLGRVDHGDAYLDTDPMEKERGITIFSKQAMFPLYDREIILLDTPGHVDFSAEMERTLQVLDYAILVINGSDGVQGHTETLWKLLKHYQIPTFLFINKMDQPGTDRAEISGNLREKLSQHIVDFTGTECRLTDGVPELKLPEDVAENVSLTDEATMNRYLETGMLLPEELRRLIRERSLFPAFFGSALKLQGIDEFLNALYALTELPAYPEEFGARVFKISKEGNQRLTWLKITGGTLKTRTELLPGEKVNEIRFYSGIKYETKDTAEAGDICAVTGIRSLKTGDGIGIEPGSGETSLKPVLDYEVLPEDADPEELYRKLSELQDEFPELHITYLKELREIHVHLMGEVQTEIVKRLVKERCGISIGFGPGEILYQETIQDAVEGVGHFEPLRHYAEVHLLLEPLPRGTGLQFALDCPEDVLPRNWQRLVLTHLKEREHPGVLTGSPITDMRITLITGRASQKHTEGGDFREATYRAVRQGLRKAVNALLEPYYAFTLELPTEYVGRAMTDIGSMEGSFMPPETNGDKTVLKGRAPVVTMRDYARDVMVYTKGRGHLFVTLAGYDRCHNAEEVILQRGYDPDQDLLNPCSSVFCAHGSGFIVPFDQVEKYMHVESPLAKEDSGERRDFAEDLERAEQRRNRKENYTPSGHYIGDQELENIFINTYGKIRNRAQEVNEAAARTIRAASREEPPEKYQKKPLERRKQYLLVDGYNIIFAWKDLNELARTNLDAARGKLLDILSNYQGFTGKEVIAVFDAYRVSGHPVEKFRFHNIYVVFTREAMTADQYIEEEAHRLSATDQIAVATSDKVVQVITWRDKGTEILSAQDLLEEIERINHKIRTEHLSPGSIPREHLTAPMQLPEDGGSNGIKT